MRILSLGAESGGRLPGKERVSPLDLGLSHFHPFGEHRRPRRALSILGREVALPKARRHESNFFEGTVGKRSVQASRDHTAYHQAPNCEPLPDLFRLGPSAREAHRAASAFDAGPQAEQKVNAKVPNHPLATASIFSSVALQNNIIRSITTTANTLILYKFLFQKIFFIQKNYFNIFFKIKSISNIKLYHIFYISSNISHILLNKFNPLPSQPLFFNHYIHPIPYLCIISSITTPPQ